MKATVIDNLEELKSKSKNEEELPAILCEMLDEIVSISNEESGDLYSKANIFRNKSYLLKECSEEYLSENDFFPKLVHVVQNEKTDSNSRFILIQSINHISTVIAGAFEQCLTTEGITDIFMKCFDTEDIKFFSAACAFFTNCLNHEKIELLQQIDLLEHFLEMFGSIIEKIPEYELNDAINLATENSAKLLLLLIKKYSPDDLDAQKPAIHDIVVSMYLCPIFYMIVKETAAIVLELGRKFGFLDMTETEMFGKTMSILSDFRCSLAFNSVITIINETITEDKENKIGIESFPLDDIMFIVKSMIQERRKDNSEPSIPLDNELAESLIRLMMSIANSGEGFIEHLTNEDELNNIVELTKRGNYEVSMLGQELLWIIMQKSDKEVALSLTENQEVVDILMKSFSDDNEEAAKNVIDNYIGPFVDFIVKGGPFEYDRFGKFLDAIKESLDDILDSENEEISELAQRVNELLDSIPRK